MSRSSGSIAKVVSKRVVATSLAAGGLATSGVVAFTGFNVHAATSPNGAWFQSTNINATSPLSSPGTRAGTRLGTQAHAFMSNTGQLVYCALSSAQAPSAGGTTHQYYAAGRFTGAYAGQGDGSFSANSTKLFAYIINKYGQGGRDWVNHVPSITQQAQYVTAVDWVKGYLGHNNTQGSYEIAPNAATRTLGLQMIAEANKYAGTSYTPKVTISGTPKVGGTGTLSSSLVSSNGSKLSGERQTITLSGNATFSNGSKTAIVMTNGTDNYTIKYTGSGAVTASTTINNVMDTGVNYSTDKNSYYQRVFLGGVTANKTASAAVTVPVSNYSPVVSTQTSLTKTNGANIPVTDKISVSKGAPNSTVTVNTTLWGPLATKPTQAASVPANTPKIGTVSTTVKLDASGNGTATTSHALNTKGAGWYVWTENLPASGTNTAYNSPFGVSTESGVNTDVTMSTKVGSANVATNGNLTDSINVSGTVDQPGVISATLWHYTPAAGETCNTTIDDSANWAAKIADGSATKVSTQNVNVTKDGVVSTVPVKATSEGCYTWSENFAYQGSTATIASTSAGAINEVTSVVTPASHPQLTSTSSLVQSNGYVNGAKVSTTDTIKITGAQPNSTVNVKNTLYKTDVAVDATATAVPDGATAVGTVTKAVTVDASGNATVEMPALDTSGVGYYTWQAEIVGDADNDNFVAPFGADGESAPVTDISMKTHANVNEAKVGDEVFDNVEVSGSLDQSAVLTVNSWAYAPKAGEVCSVVGDNIATWASKIASGEAKIQSTTTLNVSGDGSYATAPIIAKDGMCYSWSEEYRKTGDTAVVAATKPGEVSEVTKISTTPTPTPTPTPTTTPVVGPKVQTDFVGLGSDASGVEFALGAFGVLAAAGAAVGASKKNVGKYSSRF